MDKAATTEKNAETSAAGTPQRSDKAPRPEGTSPMKIVETEHSNRPGPDGPSGLHAADADSSTKSDPKDSDSGSKGGSLDDVIASARKELFKEKLSTTESDDAITTATSRSRKWKPINKMAGGKLDSSKTVVDLTDTGGNRRGTTFATDTNFKGKEASAAATPRPGRADKNEDLKETVTQVRIRILPGAEDIQDTVFGLMHHCLTTLKERDNTACFANSERSLMAHKRTDFPRDFTDFYDDWGVWDEPTKSFLNTMPTGRGRSFTGSFYFRSTWEPEKLFEKTLLKMAAVPKLKGTIAITVKACQHLDTERAVILFNVPFCSASSLRSILRKAMTEQKSSLIKRHPAKWPPIEWGRPLPDFDLIRDFVKNTPWRAREEKSTIQAYHKLAWQLECPTEEADRIYKLLKAMKTNKSIYRVLGDSATILRAPGPKASEDMKKQLGMAVAFHTAFQMSINFVILRGFLDPDKAVEVNRIEDEDGDDQEAVRLSVRQVMYSHKVNHLPLWQAIVQNEDGSWRGYYSNGKGCQNHKGVATAWGGAIGAHLKFHLLKRGVTEASALKLVRASCSAQTFHDACTSTYKDGKVVSAAQAEIDNELEEMQKRASWVDITAGMEASERQEYDAEHIIQRLDPSDPRALNFEEDQSLKTLSSQAAGTTYTIAPAGSIGTTAYAPPDDEIDSQESDLFGLDGDEDFTDDPFHDDVGGVIANMEAVGGSTVNTAQPNVEQDVEMYDEDKEGQPAEASRSVSSPEKITRMTMDLNNLPTIPTEIQREAIHNMLREWVETRGTEALPPSLQLLADRIGVATPSRALNLQTPLRERRGQRDRVSSPIKTLPPTTKLEDSRFVLNGKWPKPDDNGLLSGREIVKELIERHGGKVTAGFSNSTDFLVIGTTPGHKTVVEAHERGIQIITLEQVESVIINDDMAVADLDGPYPDAAYAILTENGIQVQRSTQQQDLEDGANDTTTANAAAGPNVELGEGHRDG